MPQLAIFKGEKSLDDLAARLFRVNGGTQARKQATEALVRANPHLANLDRLPPGSVVVVPDTPHAVNAGEVMQPANLATVVPVRSVGEQVNGFTNALAAVSKDAAARADATLKLLDEQSLKAASANDPDLAQRL